jgi:hypothetical protein
MKAVRLKTFQKASSHAWAAICTLAVAITTLAQPIWHGPDPVIGVGSTEPPGVARGGPHVVDIVLTGPNGHLYWQWPSSLGVYTTPVDLNDVGATSGPTVVVGGRNKIDAFYRGKNGNLWTSWWDGTWWSAPTDLVGVPLGSAPTAVQGGAHRLEVFYPDTQGRLRESYWDSGNAFWSAPGTFAVGGVQGPVAAVTNGPHRIDVFYRSSNNRLMHFWSDGGPWSAPESMGTVITSNPSGASLLNPSSTRAAVFYRDGSGILNVLDSSKHGAWTSQSSGIKIGVKLAAVTVDEVFAMGLDTPNGPIATGTVRVWRTAK